MSNPSGRLSGGKLGEENVDEIVTIMVEDVTLPGDVDPAPGPSGLQGNHPGKRCVLIYVFLHLSPQ